MNPVNSDQPHGRPTCGAKTRAGTPCKRAPVPGRTRCRLHGGLTPAGASHYNFKTGRYSKVLPARLRERYEEAAADPELLALREDIALLDSRLDDLLKRVDAGESDTLWKQVHSAWREHKKARRRDDEDAERETFEELDELISRGIGDLAAWAEVRQALEQRRRLVESERKRLVDMQQMLTAEQAMVFVTAVTDAVRRHVTDRKTLTAIARELVQLTSVPGRGNALTGDG